MASRRRAVGERLLCMLGRFPDVVADDVEQFSDFDPWLLDIAGDCDCKWTVGALAVERGLAVLGGVDHHETRRRFDVRKSFIDQL